LMGKIVTMQTFLPYSDFTKSAACLDNKRLGCQRKECLQILKVLACGPEQVLYEDKWVSPFFKDSKPRRKTPWYNHPAVRMWRDHEQSLIDYGECICAEWVERGYEDACWNKITTFRGIFGGLFIDNLPPWLGNESFHASHRSALLFKNFKHYSQFGWTEKPTVPDSKGKLPYVWPV